jgi:hypothetical protein
MNESRMMDAFLSVRGAKRAADGWIIPLENGDVYHVFDVHDSKEFEGLTNDEHFFIAFCTRNEILRLRELRGPYDYLLRLRANAIVDSPRAVRVMSARKKAFENDGRAWSLTHYYHSKDNYHKSYMKSLNKSHAKIIKKIPSGLAFIAEVNALCIRSIAGDVVVVSESLEYFYYFMTIAFYGNQLGIELADRADALLIAIRIVNGSEAMDFDIDPRGDLGHELERVIGGLVVSQMQFTFGHEFAHLLRGHLPTDLTSSGGAIDLPENLKTYNYEMEYEADHFSIKHIEHDGRAFHSIAQGAFSALLYLHFLREIKDLCRLPGLSISATHPDPMDRIFSLHRRLGKKSPVSERTLNNMLTVSADLSGILKHRLEHMGREDILDFYGSVYLPSYTKKPRQDRYDF